MRFLLLSILFTGTFAKLNAAPFQNGGFEVGPAIPVNFCGACGASYIGTFFAPYTGIPGWSVTAGSIDIIGPPGWTASEGSRSIDLDGLSAATLAQTFDTILGSTYQVSFDLAANFYTGQTIKSLMVNAPGFSQTYTFDSTGRTALNMGWRTESFQFVAAGTSSTLSFASLDIASSAFGPALDNVRVNGAAGSAVPEPSTWLIAAMGLSGIIMRRRGLPPAASNPHR
jgi:choice-of-anchor C domain-containing protein